MDFDSDQSLKEWAKDKPLSILQLDPADRAVLRIAGNVVSHYMLLVLYTFVQAGEIIFDVCIRKYCNSVSSNTTFYRNFSLFSFIW